MSPSNEWKVEEIKSFRCNWCGMLYLTEEKAYECLNAHVRAAYRAAMWRESRSLGYICTSTRDDSLSDEHFKIAKKINKDVEIVLKPWGEPSKWKMIYNPYKHTFPYGSFCENSIKEVLQRIIDQKVKLQ